MPGESLRMTTRYFSPPSAPVSSVISGHLARCARGRGLTDPLAVPVLWVEEIVAVLDHAPEARLVQERGRAAVLGMARKLGFGLRCAVAAVTVSSSDSTTRALPAARPRP